MKALIQRVSSAGVTVNGNRIGSINRGLCVFAGIAADDTREDIDYLAAKILGMRIFADNSGKFNLSITEINGELLLISQFTLMATTRKGRRPSFTRAAPPEMAEDMFGELIEKCRLSGLKTETGQFQAYMQVEIVNDGPVTIMLDSRER